jgi:hypothetical protein
MTKRIAAAAVALLLAGGAVTYYESRPAQGDFTQDDAGPAGWRLTDATRARYIAYCKAQGPNDELAETVDARCGCMADEIPFTTRRDAFVAAALYERAHPNAQVGRADMQIGQMRAAFACLAKVQ